MLDNDKIDGAYAYAQRCLTGDGSGHGMDHIDRVLANARLLLQSSPEANALIVLSAAALHDTYDAKLVDDKAAARSRLVAELCRLQYTADQQQAILAIIDQMSFSYGLEHTVHLDVNGQIVQDADRLDAIGAIGIARAFAFGGAKNRPLDDGRDAQTFTTAAEYHGAGGGTIQHFHEKLLHVAQTMNTSAAKEIGLARTEYMRGFLKEFAAEKSGER